MDLTQTVEQLVHELLRSMAAADIPSPQVLFILEDSRAADRYLDHFVTLKQAGIGHDLLLLDGETSGWLGTQCIECTGAGKCIAIDEFAPAPVELPQRYAAIAVPELDLDQASRILHGLKGSVISELVHAALLIRKPVFLPLDGSGISRTNRRTLQVTALPPGYDKRYRTMLRELQEVGVQLAPLNQFAEQIIATVLPEKTVSSQEQDSLVGSVFGGKLLTAAEAGRLLSRRKGGVLSVARGTLISPLARDVLKEHKAELRIVEEVSNDVSR
ncbi:hypothetical protein [Paenibacillus guangzhouensis]|uniref:hypothetical protein n=1 Tax=Paenibacillus guangzhouensis TaxID=1473112 RepID=UPI001266A380|nr:hypothetical protein [Paenibacillus guangzhouensis]